MRGALVCLLAALSVSGALVASSGAATVRYASATATVAVVGDKAFGVATSRRDETAGADAVVEKGNVAIEAGEAVATTTEAGPTATAGARADRIELLGGRIRARTVTREATLDGARGEITGLRVDGDRFGPIRQARTIELADGGGQLVLNEGDTGLRLVTDDLEVRIAVVGVSTFKKELPDPTPTPTPKPKPKKSPTPEPTKVPKPPQRLTAGGYAFPVYGDVDYEDTYGAARAAPIIAHEGTDVFAEFGSPVVAVRDGTLTKVGTLEISGNRLWLKSDDGDAFFYAHLSSFSTAARNGARVEAGDVLGFVGNTGDAEPTPPHVHFEVHPNGLDEDPVNPYPILRSWQASEDVPPGAWLQQLGADATERPGALVTVRDFIAE